MSPPCSGLVVAGGCPGAQEGPQFSREVCPWDIRLPGLVGLYILLFSAEKLQEA